MSWKKIKSDSFANLKKARLQLHQAVQLIARTAISYAEHQADDSHSSMAWQEKHNAFVGVTITNDLQLAFNPADLNYTLFKGTKETVATFSLAAKTEQQATDWLLSALKKHNINTAGFSTELHYEIPETEQGKGQPFELFDKNTFATLSNHFTNADYVLNKIGQKNGGASDVRCWPHHFDLGMIISIEKSEDPEKAKSIGLGFSPGDENYDEPYYYVYPWPYPEVNRLQDSDLPDNGFWHTKGFISAILKTEDFLNTEDQEQTVLEFLETTISISKKLLT